MSNNNAANMSFITWFVWVCMPIIAAKLDWAPEFLYVTKNIELTPFSIRAHVFWGPKHFGHTTTTRLYTVNRIAEIMAYLVLLAEFGQTKLERTRQ